MHCTCNEASNTTHDLQIKSNQSTFVILHTSLWTQTYELLRKPFTYTTIRSTSSPMKEEIVPHSTWNINAEFNVRLINTRSINS